MAEPSVHRPSVTCPAYWERSTTSSAVPARTMASVSESAKGSRVPVIGAPDPDAATISTSARVSSACSMNAQSASPMRMALDAIRSRATGSTSSPVNAAMESRSIASKALVRSTRRSLRIACRPNHAVSTVPTTARGNRAASNSNRLPFEFAHLRHLPLRLQGESAVELRGFRDYSARKCLLPRESVDELLERHSAAEDRVWRRLPDCDQFMQRCESAGKIRSDALGCRVEASENAPRPLMHRLESGATGVVGAKEERATSGHLVEKRELKPCEPLIGRLEHLPEHLGLRVDLSTEPENATATSGESRRKPGWDPNHPGVLAASARESSAAVAVDGDSQVCVAMLLSS